ncbi:MAG: glycosyltransferase family 4 protein [Chloroflexi bacterium]|nr:glycosyltransferase family 4 protein [Chloroflexota bacterium]
MNIGFVIYGSLDTLSGGYLYDRKLVDYLRAQGDTVEIISLPWRNYAAHLTDNLSFRLPTGLRTSVRNNIEKRTEVRAPGQFDILIQDELNHASLIAANAGKHPYPVVSLVHHLRCSELRPKWQNNFYRVIERKYLQSVDGFIFNSQTTQGVVNGLVRHGKPSLVAYPPTNRFGVMVTEEEIIERAAAPELRILFLGNVMFRKGLHTLIDALKHAARIGNLHYVVDVVGSLEVEPAYAKTMQEKSAPLSSFLFHGPLNNEPLIEKLKQSHVLVVPSSYEGFGIVYLEGMGFGLPAIGTDLGAAQEVIADGVDGFIVSAGNAVELAERLKLLAEQRGTLIRMSIAARERFLRQPTWEQTAESIRQFLKGML